MINPTEEPDKHIRIKRLIYRSSHRGCKETDLVLEAFAHRQLAQLPEHELDLYEQLLEEHDQDIWNWLTEKTPPAPAYEALIYKIQAYLQPAA